MPEPTRVKIEISIEELRRLVEVDKAASEAWEKCLSDHAEDYAPDEQRMAEEALYLAVATAPGRDCELLRNAVAAAPNPEGRGT